MAFPPLPSSSFLTLHILFLFLILLLLLSSQNAAVNGGDGGDIIDEICKKTPFFDLCSTTLHSNPLTPKSDLKSIAVTVINDILANATDTLNFMEDLIKHASDQKLEQSLAFCAESYIPVVKYTLPQAADAVAHCRFGFAGYCVGDALKEVENCDKRLSPVSSPLGDRNDVVRRLVGVASAIIRLLLKGSV